jgi:hypothetical protein
MDQTPQTDPANDPAGDPASALPGVRADLLELLIEVNTLLDTPALMRLIPAMVREVVRRATGHPAGELGTVDDCRICQRADYDPGTPPTPDYDQPLPARLISGYPDLVQPLRTFTPSGCPVCGVEHGAGDPHATDPPSECPTCKAHHALGDAHQVDAPADPTRFEQFRESLPPVTGGQPNTVSDTVQ